jgi:hypothetical protein
MAIEPLDVYNKQSRKFKNLSNPDYKKWFINERSSDYEEQSNIDSDYIPNTASMADNLSITP